MAETRATSGLVKTTAVASCCPTTSAVKDDDAKLETAVFTASGTEDCNCGAVCETTPVATGTRTVGMTAVTLFAGAGKMVGSFLILAVLETAVGATLDGLGGAGRIAGSGLDLTCVVTVGAGRLGVI